METFTVTQDGVVYVIKDDLSPTSMEKILLNDKSIEYVFYVNGKILTYMDCVIDNLLDDMKRMRILWYYPKEQSNEFPKFVQKLKVGK